MGSWDGVEDVIHDQMGIVQIRKLEAPAAATIGHGRKLRLPTNIAIQFIPAKNIRKEQ
jgi:hypothetical protein